MKNLLVRKLICSICLLLVCYSCTAQQQHEPLGKYEDGKYGISYIHNIYNRTEDVVKKAGEKYIKSLKHVDATTIKDDAANKRISAIVNLTYDHSSCKKCCTQKVNVNGTVYIYYKDNRSKIEFTDFVVTAGDDCADKPLEAYMECKACENVLFLAYLRVWASETSAEYKDYLKKVSKDRSIF